MAHVSEQPPLPSEVNPEVPTAVEMVLLQALEKEPSMRQETAGELAADFKRAVDQSGLTALSDNRSGVFQPMPNAPVTPTNSGGKPKPKPKHQPATDQTLLLFKDEASWANLPREEIAERRLKKRRDNRIGVIGHLIPYLAVNAIIIWGDVGDGEFGFGSLIPALGWGAGLAAHIIAVYYYERQQVQKVYQDFDNILSERYDINWREWLAESDIRAGWQQALENYEQRMGFAVHTASYILINILIWLTWVMAMNGSDHLVFPYPAIVNAAWGFGLVMHGLYVRGLMQRRSTLSHEKIQEELDLMSGGSSVAFSAKRKNDLADESYAATDGEFTDSVVDELEGRQSRR